MPDTERVEEFVRLLTKHELRLRAFVMSIIPNHADAEDVLQEATLKVWKSFSQFTPGTSFMSWAGRVFYTTAMEHHRRQRRGKIHFGDAFVEAVARVGVFDDDVAARAGEREQILGDCVAKLRPDQQELLRARYVENRSAESIGALFNRSAAAILNALSRIRRTLHDCVSRQQLRGGI